MREEIEARRCARQAAEAQHAAAKPAVQPNAQPSVSKIEQPAPAIQESVIKAVPSQNNQQKLEPQVSEEQLTISGNQSTVNSAASAIRRAKKKIVLEVLNVTQAEGTNQPLVSVKMDTSHKTVTFRFAPGSDQPSVIVRKLVDQDCLTECHMNAVIEQLDKIIEVINSNPEKSVGLRLTSIVEQQPSPENIVVRQQPMEIHHSVTTPTEEVNPITTLTSTPSVPMKINRFSVAPCQINEPTNTETTPAIEINAKKEEIEEVESKSLNVIENSTAVNGNEKVSRFSVTPSQVNGIASDSAPATIHLGDLHVRLFVN